MANQELITRAQAYIDMWNERVARLLGYEPITITAAPFPPEDDRPAPVAGSPGHVFINPELWDPKDIGGIVFEITRSYGISTDSKDDIAKADAVRYILLQDRADRGNKSWELSPAAQKYVDNYERAVNDPTPGYTQIAKEGIGPAPGTTDGSGIDTSGAPTGDTSGEDERAAMLKRRRRTKAAIELYIQSLGIPIDDDMQQLINEGARKGWSEAQIQLKIQDTAAFRQRFPGIFDQDGTLKMSPAEYIQTEKAYQAYASSAGINMNGKRMAYLFRNDVTPEEFQDRSIAFSRLTKNKELYSSFKRELVQAGVAKPADVNTNKEMFKFLMGEGNKKWADLWQDSITRYQANQAGITIARNKDRYTSIGQKAIEHISNMGLSEEEMAQKFVQLSDVLGTVLPLQEAQLYGVKKKTALQAVFGGKGSARAKDKLERAINTDEAFYEDRATSQVYSDERGGLITQGVTDRSKQQQSEY